MIEPTTPKVYEEEKPKENYNINKMWLEASHKFSKEQQQQKDADKESEKYTNIQKEQKIEENEVCHNAEEKEEQDFDIELLQKGNVLQQEDKIDENNKVKVIDLADGAYSMSSEELHNAEIKTL